MLTAAHCAENAIFVDVTLGTNTPFSAGSEGYLKLQALETITHPKFDFPNYDITLVRLPRKVDFSDFISPICLPAASEEGLEYAVKGMTASGWGYISEGFPFPNKDLMRIDDLHVISDQKCRDLFEGNELGETFFCVDSVRNGQGGYGTCNVRLIIN